MEQSLKYRVAGYAARKLRRILHPVARFYRRYQMISKRRIYHTWAVNNEIQCFVEDNVHSSPMISIVSAVYNTEPTHLREMIYSIVNQHYENWELILINVSDNKKSSDFVISCASIDSRIHVIPAKNVGISENTNIGIEKAKGQYIAFVDHDDTLHACALHSSIQPITKGAGIVYTDEDKITHDGLRFFQPLCKPDWSPHLFENLNYINHLTIIKTELVRGVKGLRPECNGSQDYDLIWRIVDKYKPDIAHIPRVLYHWRAAKTSTASSISNKSYIFKAGTKTLTDHFLRQKLDVEVEPISGKPGFYRNSYPSTKYSFIVGPVLPSRQPAAARWIEKLISEKRLNPDQIIIGDWYIKYASKKKIKAHIINDMHQYSLVDLIDQAKNEVVIVCNDAIIPRDEASFREMASLAGLGDYMIQPLIVDANNKVIDAGMVDGRYGLQPLFKNIGIDEGTFFGDADWVRDISQVSGKVYATTKTRIKNEKEKNRSDILWAHSVCDYIGPLQDMIAMPTFNPQLEQASFEIPMSYSGWGYHMERESE